MLLSVIFENLFSPTQIIWNVLALFLIFATARLFISLLNYVIWRQKILKNIPGIQMRFFSILGTASDLLLKKKSRSRQSVLVYFQQLLLGQAKLLEKEKLYCLWVFFYPVIILLKAEAVEAIFSGTKNIEKSWFYQWLKPLVGNGVLTSTGNRWKSDRKMLNPCFRTDIMKEHLQMMNVKSQFLVNRLEAETEKDFTRISKYLSDCTFDIICEIIYGMDMGAQQSQKETAEFLNSANAGFRIIIRRFLNVFLWFDFLFKYSNTGKETMQHSQVVRDFTSNLIDKEKQKFLEDSEPSEKKGKSFIKLLLEQYYLSSDISEEDIRDQLITFMIAGEDTIKIALTWILYILGLHADIQAKIYEELNLIFGEDHERYATWEDLKRMKYLNCVIKETMRLYPPGAVMSRHISEDTMICGYQVPKGTTCLVFPLVLHRDEKVFPNPEKFDPDRFLPENSATRHPYAWIPFSAGPRNCIGQKLANMEILTVTSTILRQYTVKSLDHRDKVLPALTLGLSSSIPIRIRIRKRH